MTDPAELARPQLRLRHVSGDGPNRLIIGDNRDALRLLPDLAGQAAMLYVDPPYNTGHDLLYADRRASDGIESWASFLAERLALALPLLAPDGLLFASIDDRQQPHLRLMLDDLLGVEHFVGQMVWRSRRSEDARGGAGLSSDHEYVLVYRRSSAGRLRGVPVDLNKFKNPDRDPRGPWRSADMTGLASKERRPNLHYELVHPDTGEVFACPTLGWRFDRAAMAARLAEGRVLWPRKAGGRPRQKLFVSELRRGTKNLSSWLTGFSTADGTRELAALLGPGRFPFPKPLALMRLLIDQATTAHKAALVVDLFAGSGTTGEAVARCNAADGGDRRFLLLETAKIAPITAARLDAVRQRIGALDLQVHEVSG